MDQCASNWYAYTPCCRSGATAFWQVDGRHDAARVEVFARKSLLRWKLQRPLNRLKAKLLTQRVGKRIQLEPH
jgi:hypothetical protein